MRLSRRHLLAGLAALPLASLAVAGLGGALTRLREAYLGLCGPDLAARLRRSCRPERTVPDAAAKLDDLAAGFARASREGVAFEAWLKARAAEDFAAGRVVRVEGWVLAESEVLLYTDRA